MTKKLFVKITVVLLLSIGLFVYESNSANLSQKKIVHIDSYHKEYPWSAGMVKDMDKVLDEHSIKVHRHYMDTKRNKSEEYKKQAALEAKKFIDTHKPDLIISTDDNASKYLIVPYYKGKDIPVIVAGIQWGGNEYGFPASNVTGVIETELVDELLVFVNSFYKVDDVAFIAGDTFSSRKIYKVIREILGIEFKKTAFVSTCEEFKKAYVDFQEDVDMVYIQNLHGIDNFNNDQKIDFIKNNTKVITGSSNDFTHPYVAVSYAKVSGEHGELAAKLAVDVLNGKPISDIPLQTNREGTVIINKDIVDVLGIEIPEEVLKSAKLVSNKSAEVQEVSTGLSNKKILHIDSYHKGYPWSDNIATGISKALSSFDVEVKRHYLDTKINKNEDFKKQAALEARKVIEEYKPDIVIATDDNASKYLVVPYYKDKEIPFIVAGLNGDAKNYDFPAPNVTGVLEINAVDEALEVISTMTKVDKVSVIVADTLSERKEVKFIKKMFGIEFAEEIFVSSFDEWKKKFKELQNKSDVVFVGNVYGIKDMDYEEAKQFVVDNSKKISFTTTDHMCPYAAICYARLAEEQGELAANMALDVLKGRDISTIPMDRNRKGKIFINEDLVNKLGVHVPVEILESAEIID